MFDAMFGQQGCSKATVVALAVSVMGGQLSVALVDAGQQVRGTHVESRHDPGGCSRHHDHAACSQLLSSVWDSPDTGQGYVPLRVSPTAPAVPPIHIPPVQRYSPLSPRAPPLNA